MDVIKEHERVVLTTDIRGEKLAAGDVGTVVNVYREGAAFEVEFVSLGGETVAIVTLAGPALQQLKPDLPCLAKLTLAVYCSETGPGSGARGQIGSICYWPAESNTPEMMAG